MIKLELDSIHCATIAAFAKHVAPSKEVRQHLNAVWLECTTEGWIVLATDGHRMVIDTLNLATCAGDVGTTIAIPQSIALQVAKAKEAGATLEFEPGADALITVGATRHTIGTSYQDLKLVDWRRVIPTSRDNAPAQFNPQYLASFDNIAVAIWRARRKFEKDLNGAVMKLGHNGHSAALVTFDTLSLFGIVMPLRSEPLPDDMRPSWLKGAIRNSTATSKAA